MGCGGWGFFCLGGFPFSSGLDMGFDDGFAWTVWSGGVYLVLFSRQGRNVLMVQMVSRMHYVVMMDMQNGFHGLETGKWKRWFLSIFLLCL